MAEPRRPDAPPKTRIEKVGHYLARGRRLARRPASGLQGARFGQRLSVDERSAPTLPGNGHNPLTEYFDGNVEGPGIWKWRHYFDLYHRHLSKFVGQQVNIVEIGVYSGGSLGMWREYFGAGARIFGVDIQEECRAYESEEEGVRIFIGDQADPEFWARFVSEVPSVDIVIDDGGHEFDQQVATLEALLPHLRPGGVFICEDLIGIRNAFHHYVCGMSRMLNEPGEEPNELQRFVESISLYPYATVIERRAGPLDRLVAERRGTEWQPYFDYLGIR